MLDLLDGEQWRGFCIAIIIPFLLNKCPPIVQFLFSIKKYFNIPILDSTSLAQITVQKLEQKGLYVDAEPTLYVYALAKMIEDGTTPSIRKTHGGSIAEALADLTFDEQVQAGAHSNPAAPLSPILLQQTVCDAIQGLSLYFDEEKIDVACPIPIEHHPNLPTAPHAVTQNGGHSNRKQPDYVSPTAKKMHWG
jgi:hypothetical protein